MSGNIKSSRLRSLIKALSWRIVAIIDSILVVLLVTCLLDRCGINVAIQIGLIDFIIKLILYYLHERQWLWLLGKEPSKNNEILIKTISWRLIAGISTYIVSGYILDSFDKLAVLIVIIELFSKFVLFYIHEKLWLKTKFLNKNL